MAACPSSEEGATQAAWPGLGPNDSVPQHCARSATKPHLRSAPTHSTCYVPFLTLRDTSHFWAPSLRVMATEDNRDCHSPSFLTSSQVRRGGRRGFCGGHGQPCRGPQRKHFASLLPALRILHNSSPVYSLVVTPGFLPAFHPGQVTFPSWGAELAAYKAPLGLSQTAQADSPTIFQPRDGAKTELQGS